MPVIVAIAGPSGAGKTVLSNMLKDEGYAEIVSVTTRAPRKGEVNGVHYTFLNEADFLELKDNNGLVESMNINGNYYGVPAAEAVRVANEGRPIVVVTDPHGLAQMNKYCEENDWKCVRVFVNSPLDVLIERLQDRYKGDLKNLDESSATYEQDKAKLDKTYSSRLDHVQGKEQNEWVRPAKENPELYDMIINEFNAKVQDKVLSNISLHVESLLQEENQPKRRRGPRP